MTMDSTDNNIVLYLPECADLDTYVPTLQSASPFLSLHPLTPSLDPKIKQQARGLAVRGGVPIPNDLIDSLPSLRIVSMFGVGYDNVPIQHCLERGIVVTHTPNVLNECVADLTVGLVVCVAREIPQCDQYVREGKWENEGVYKLTTKVSKKRVGIVGMGRIGRVIGERLEKGLGMDIFYYSRSKKEDLPNYSYCKSVEELAELVQFLVVIVPGGPETTNMINENVLRKLGKDGYLINVARGCVVDEEALVKCLKNGTIKGAALDVFIDEPRVSKQLTELSNVLLVPHIGSATKETRLGMAQMVTDNMVAFFKGTPLVSPVPECQS